MAESGVTISSTNTTYVHHWGLIAWTSVIVKMRVAFEIVHFEGNMLFKQKSELGSAAPVQSTLIAGAHYIVDIDQIVLTFSHFHVSILTLMLSSLFQILMIPVKNTPAEPIRRSERLLDEERLDYQNPEHQFSCSGRD